MANTTGKKFGGRVKGTPNRINADVVDSIMSAFHALNGNEGLIKWAQENPTEFYKSIFGKLIPKDINVGGQPDNPVITFVIESAIQGAPNSKGKVADGKES